jgi:hypothetical protein
MGVSPSGLVELFYGPTRRCASGHANIVDRHSFFDQCAVSREILRGAAMATVVAPGADRKSSERKFYTRMALFLVFIVLLGFGPSFYLRGIVPSYPRPNPTLPPWVILHGTVFTLWMAVLVAQTQLIAARKHEIHMRLGKAAMLFAILLVPVMYLTAVWQVARANQAPFTDPLTWTIVPLAVIIPFIIVVWNGWAKRRDAQSHKRLMLSAAIMVMMGPAVGRLPLAPPTRLGMSLLLLLGLALFIPLLVRDRRTLGHLHPATKLGFSMAAISVMLPLAVFWFDLSWAKVAAKLPGVGA